MTDLYRESLNEFIDKLKTIIRENPNTLLGDINWEDYEMEVEGRGSSRLVFREGDYVFKVAFTKSGQIQNWTEHASNRDDEYIADTFESINALSMENLINVQSYYERSDDYIYNLIADTVGRDKFSYEDAISVLTDELEYLEDEDDNKSKELREVFLNLRYNLREGKEGKQREHLLSEAMLNFYLLYAFEGLPVTEAALDKDEANSENIGVKVDDNGDYVSFVVIDDGFDVEVQPYYDGELDNNYIAINENRELEYGDELA